VKKESSEEAETKLELDHSVALKNISSYIE
jgi:hypothetical protein